MNDFVKNLNFSLNATIPVFVMMVFGWFLQKIKILDDHTTQKINQFVFKIYFPHCFLWIFLQLILNRSGTLNSYYSVFQQLFAVF